MPAAPATTCVPADSFAATHWSVILAAADSQVNSADSSAALAALCQIYWPPLYTFVRARGHSVHDAQDLTQGFFAFLIEHKIYKRAKRTRGKFRSFLLASFKNFLSDARDREQTLKRGGGHAFVTLDDGRAEAAESLFKTHHAAGERLFDRAWAETLIEIALERTAGAYKAEGKENLFENLKAFLTVGAAPLPSYADLAIRLSIAESTLRSHVARLRGRYRDMLRAEVRRTVATDAEVDTELRELLRVLTDR